MFESTSLSNVNSTEAVNIYKNTFSARNDYLAYKEYCIDRSQNSKLPKKQINRIKSLWDKKPVDFTWRLFQPKPPKRNSREAIKPWEYDRYLRPVETVNSSLSDFEKSEQEFGEQFLNESLNKAFHIKSESIEFQDFSTLFKPLTASKAKMEAAKTMSYREGFDQYEGSINKFPLRELKPLPGIPDFTIKTEKDPYGIKFRSKHLNQIHGEPIAAVMRNVEGGEQMGDSFKISHLKYDSSLILPKLKFPNKYNCFTRHKKNNERTPESVFWDRALPKIKKMWEEEKLQNNLSTSLP